MTEQGFMHQMCDAAKRVIGRGHLLAMGFTAKAIARWLRLGVLERTADRGFYWITHVALAGLRSETKSSAPTSDDPVALDRVEPWMLEWAADLKRAIEAEKAAIAAPDCGLRSGATILPPVSAPKPSEAPPVPEPKVPAPTSGCHAGDGLQIVPCTLRRARAFCTAHHRHHGAPTGGLFALGLACAGELVGVAVVGRPVARALQDGATAEVTRVCTLGAPNACSKLLGACRRVARDLGYRRLVTYTLSEEPGTSLRAAGWIQTASVPGRSWDRRARRRRTTTLGDKRRWEAPLPAAAPN